MVKVGLVIQRLQVWFQASAGIVDVGSKYPIFLPLLITWLELNELPTWLPIGLCVYSCMYVCMLLCIIASAKWIHFSIKVYKSISLSKSRKKLGSCSRSVHVNTLRRFPMTKYLKGKRKRQWVKWYVLDRNPNSAGQMQVGLHLSAELWFYHGIFPISQETIGQKAVDASSPYPTASTLQTHRFSCAGTWVDQMSPLYPPSFITHTHSYGNPCALVARANRACHAYCSCSVPYWGAPSCQSKDLGSKIMFLNVKTALLKPLILLGQVHVLEN